MIRTSGNLVIPIVTWAPTPPVHKVCSILVSDDGTDVVTGGSDGNMILWSVRKNGEFIARWMVTGHRAPVRHLCLAGSRSDENIRIFFSHSSASELALWNWQDGKCMEFKVDTRHQHTTIKSHQPAFLDYRLLFCCGRYPHIVVLHAMSLSVLFTLASQAHSDWVSSFTVFTHPNQKHEIVLGISFSNMVTLWTLNGEEVQGEANYEHESRVISCPSTVLQVHYCPQTPRCVLLVTDSGWQLLDAMTCSVFCAHPNPLEDPLVGGQFVDSNLLAIFCRSGIVLLYRVIPRLTTGQQTGSSPSLYSDPPVLLAKLSPEAPSPLTNGLKTDNLCSISTTNQRGVCSFFVPESSLSPPSLFGGTEWGAVLSWRLDPFVCSAGFDQSRGPVQELIPPTAYCDLQSIWRENPPQGPLDLLQNRKCIPNGDPSGQSSVDHDTITVCVQLLQMSCSRSQNKTVTHPDRLAFGLSSGRILVVRLTDFLRMIYCQSTGDEKSSTTGLLNFSSFSLEGHEGPVTSLLHPASADDQCVRSLDDVSEDKTTASNVPQFNPDHLVSGGADFTVRLWDLDPWRETHTDRRPRVQSGVSSGNLSLDSAAPACLAVFRCHASPCVSLSIGPPSCAILQATAGNPRLSACICSVGADGSVSLISLREQRILLSTTPCYGVSGSPVTALGWRVPEDMLFVAHTDGLLEVWDISLGCLDRLESDGSARDLFEQAHYVVEIQPSSASFSTSLSQLSYQSTPVGAHTNRAPTLVFAGCANNSHASGSVLHTARARLRRSPHSHKRSSPHHRVPAVLLHAIGVTNYGHKSTPGNSLLAGPAAFVFHWDTEAIILNLLAENACVSEKNSADSFDTDANLSSVHGTSLVRLLQLFVSSLHPWGLDSEADHAVLACVGSGDKVQIGEPKLGAKVRILENLCVGLVSKHGCLSLCLPGWSSSECSRANTETRSVSRLYCLSHGISTNLMLAELSLCETLTSLNTDCAEQLLQLSDVSRDKPVVLTIGDAMESPVENKVACFRAGWLQLAARLCGPLLAQCVWGSPQLQASQACRLPELEILVQKWQDRMIPIRYAARTLLFAYLDHLGHANRQVLVNKWSSLLPLFATTQSSKPTVGSPAVGEPQSLNNSPAIPRSHLLPERKQSLPMQSITDSATDRRTSTSVANGSVPNSKPTSPQRTVHRPPASQGLPSCLRSVSLCSLESAGLVSHSVTDSHWWLTLSGYRVSPREHARLQRQIRHNQAIAIVLLGAIGTRFGTAVCRRHPAVCARDLIDDSKPIYQSNTLADGSGAGSSTVRNPGLASPCFSSPDVADDRSSQRPGLSSKPLSVEYFAPVTSHTETNVVVPDGFSFDNHQLARSTCQCLVAMLFNRAGATTGDHSSSDSPGNRLLHTIADRQPSSSSSSAIAANALVSLLMSNAHSSLRRASIDLLSRGFIVWEPYVDLGHLLNALLHIVADAEQLLCDLAPWQPISDHVDLARTAREALWAIAFARPKSFILVLSLEVRRYGSQINAAASAVTTPSPLQSQTSINSSNAHTAPIMTLDASLTPNSVDVSSISPGGRRDSSHLATSGSMPGNPRMMVMMASPAVTAPVFAPPLPAINLTAKSTAGTGPWPPMFAARDELVRLFEQLCVRRATDIVAVLPEIVEVILACLDRTRLKERGLDFVFPALRQFSSFSSHTRVQKACVGGVNGSLTFFDFKIGRYFVTSGHKGPVTAVRFHSDGRMVATYSLTESTLRIWQLHSTGLFGMGGQQVKAVSTHPVPPLLPPPKHVSSAADNVPSETHSDGSVKADCISFDPIAVWLDWPEAHVVHLITESGVKRRVNV